MSQHDGMIQLKDGSWVTPVSCLVIRTPEEEARRKKWLEEFSGLTVKERTERARQRIKERRAAKNRQDAG